MACKDAEFSPIPATPDSQKADDLISTMLEDHEKTPGLRFRSLRKRATSKPPASSRDPENSMMTNLWRSPTIKEEIDDPIGCLAIRKSHWKRSGIKCANTECKKQLTSQERPRNCSMCGEMFCHTCTNFNRNLSIYARPDTLGHPHSVCITCYNRREVFGIYRDQMGDFRAIRQARINSINKNEAEQRLIPLCSRRTSETKRKAVEEELQRLLDGYRANLGKIKGIVSELVIPDWHKSSNWVKDLPACSNCGSSFNVLKRKSHCRVGGQIFCSKCSSEDLVLYVNDDSGEVNWALNGKGGGGLTSEPNQFRLLSICQSCSTEMEAILSEINLRPPPSVFHFQDSLKSLHSQLSKMQTTIEANLPAYRDLVESMYLSDHTADGKHPMRKLVKAHSDLSDAFSSFAVESQKLKRLKPKTDPHQQCQNPEEKLLRNVMMGIHRFYTDNMSSFRQLQNHLSKHVPIETLASIQAELSLQSMERFHVLMQQLVLEAINLQQKYSIDGGFLASIITITQYMDIEFREFVEGRGDSWEKHSNLISKFISAELKNKRHRISIDDSVHYHHVYYHYLVVSQCSSLIHELNRELLAKTVDKEFKQVKSSLSEACVELDTILVQLNAK